MKPLRIGVLLVLLGLAGCKSTSPDAAFAEPIETTREAIRFTELVEAHRAFDSGAADFDAITVRLKEDQGAVAEVFLDTREAMREHMTREEWAAVFGAEKK